MPPKRRTTAKSAPAPSKAAPASAPNPPKPIVPLAKAAAPPPPPPPPPPPVETPSAKVRKAWLNFISTWYEPAKKKLADQIMKELDVKYKKAASRIQQAARQAEKEKRLSEIAAQLSEPAHEEWEKRLATAQLQVDDWTDITDQEQQFVLSVFVGLFGDDNDDDDDDDEEEEEGEEEDQDSATLNSNDIEDVVTLEVDGFDFPTVRQSPPTPVTGNFELVNPSSFFADTVSPRNQSRKLPELAMDHLATLSHLNPGRNQPDPGTSTSAVFGFQGWASEAGLAVPTTTASLPQPNGRHHATDNVSRQASGASSASSPPLFSSGTGLYSPLQPMSKISPLTATQNLPPGKRYIGPVVADEEAEPIDEDLLKEKMSADFLRFKMDIRIQMIQQFHDRASAIEIELVRQLDSDSSRDSRLRTMQEHEQNMMSLRESKEIERKKLCDEERDRRLQEHRFLKQVAAQQASQARWNASVSSSKAPLNKPATQNGCTTQSAPKLAGQKENLSTGSLPTSVPKPDPPSILKKSNSARPHDPIIPGFDEAAFLRSQAEAASLARGKQPPTTASNPSNRPSALKKTESTSQDEPVEPVPLSLTTVQPPAVAKGKKGKRTPVITQRTKIVTFNEEPDIDAEPPPQPITPSAWSAKGAKVLLSSKPSKSVMIEEEPDEDADLTFSTWNAKNARATTSTSAPTKKGKAAVVSEEVDADPSPPAPSTFGWGSTPSWSSAAATTKKKKAKAPIVPPEFAEDPFQTWGAKSGALGSTSTKKTKATVTEELDEEANPSPVVSGTAWNAGLKTASSSSKQSKKVPPQPEPCRNAQASKYAWVPTVQDADEEEDEDEDEDEDEGEDGDEDEDGWKEIQTAPSMPGGMDATGEEESADAWGGSYWGSLAKGQPVRHAAEEFTKHVRWTPTVDAGESGDEDSGIMDQNMESALWMQYAISGGDASGFEIDDQQELAPPSAAAMKSNTNDSNTSIWEQGKGKGKKKSISANEISQIAATRVQQTSASSGTRTEQWQKTKMENWASRLGQSSGSARHL